MKQILLFCLFFLGFQTSVSAQNDFAPVGAYWKYNFYEMCGERQRLVKVVSDTLVNGKTFKKLAIEDFVNSRCPPPNGSRSFGTEYLSTRNDSVFMGLNQVFLFHFKAQIGDSINLKNALNGQKRYGIVDSIGQINLGGVNRRIMYFTKYCKNQQTGQITKYRTISKLVENVGLLTEGLIWEEPDCGVVDVSQYIFSCYKSPTFGYPTNVTCSPTVSTNELIANQISIFPNPANTDLTVNFPSELILNSVELVNYLGQKIKVEKGDNLQKINVSNLPNGAYFIRLLFDNQSITKKIMVQH
jgi:Secretion system C-terminal sorting domain